MKRWKLRRVDVKVSTWASATSVSVHRADTDLRSYWTVANMTEPSYQRLQRALFGMRNVVDFDDNSITVRYYPR